MARRDDPPASYYEELLDTPVPRGVHVITDSEGRITDVRLDPQEFDGPSGVPEGWSRSEEEVKLQAFGIAGLLIGFIFLGAILVAIAAVAMFVAVWFGFLHS